MIIGLTGGSGCGKTTALQSLEELGALTFDADAVYHELLERDEKLLAKLEEAFPGVLAEGKLDRKKLGSRVFGDPPALQKLNAITHPAVKKEIQRRIREGRKKGSKLFAIDAFGLMEGKLDALCDCTVAVLAPREDRIARILCRDGIREEEAAARVDSQKSDEEFRRTCDYALYNEKTEEEFRKTCRDFFQKLIEEKKYD